MGRFPSARWLLQLVLLWVCTATARADEDGTTTEEGCDQAAAYRVELGIRGAVGVVSGSGPARGGGGPVAYLAVPFVHDRWEAELSLGAIAVRGGEVLGLLEVAVERSFAVDERWTPRLVLGPVLSLDFSGELTVSGGLVGGAGITRWITRRFGITFDVRLRALFGREQLFVANGAVGVAGRI